MYYSVDAIDGALVRLVDDDEVCKVERLHTLPHAIREGDVLLFENGVYTQALEETLRRKELARQLVKGQ